MVRYHPFTQRVPNDAICVLPGVTKKTPVEIKGGQHPVWDAELRFPVMKQATEKSRKLEVACFSQERRSDDLLGKGIVDITQTLKTGEFDGMILPFFILTLST
jgi:hypothetical protein